MGVSQLYICPLKKKEENKMREIFSRVPIRDKAQIEEQAKKLVKFLKAIYPFLEDENWNDAVIELRPIKRAPGKLNYLKSYNTWHLKEKDINALIKFMSMLNGNPYCTYFSGFTFYYEQEVLKADGKAYMRGKVNNTNSMFTCILPADFDGISAEEFEKSKQRLLDLGIETIDVFTGHGFQSHILLNHRVKDKDIFKKFTELMFSKGFKVDPAIVDSARVLRLPYTFNCKALDKNQKDYYDAENPQIFETATISWTEKRYDLIDIFGKLQTLPDAVAQTRPLTEIEIKSIPTAAIHIIAEKKTRAQEIKEVTSIKIESLKDVYSMLDLKKLPEPVQKMLSGTQSGMINKVMFFLIPFLRNTLGLNIQTIKQIMSCWAELSGKDTKFITAEVDRIFKMGFRGKHGKYTSELTKAYGYLEFKNDVNLDNKIKIRNSIFGEKFAAISDGSIRIYLAMKLDEKTNKSQEFTKKDIQTIAKISERTVERNMKDLSSQGFVSKRRSNQKRGDEYIYYLNPYFGSTEGFTMIEGLTIKSMINELTDGEMKLYSYMRFMVGKESTKSCWPSQKFLAEKIGKKSQGVISVMTDNLTKKGFIIKITSEQNGIMHSVYNLNH